MTTTEFENLRKLKVNEDVTAIADINYSDDQNSICIICNVENYVKEKIYGDTSNWDWTKYTLCDDTGKMNSCLFRAEYVLFSHITESYRNSNLPLKLKGNIINEDGEFAIREVFDASTGEDLRGWKPTETDSLYFEKIRNSSLNKNLTQIKDLKILDADTDVKFNIIGVVPHIAETHKIQEGKNDANILVIVDESDGIKSIINPELLDDVSKEKMEKGMPFLFSGYLRRNEYGLELNIFKYEEISEDVVDQANEVSNRSTINNLLSNHPNCTFKKAHELEFKVDYKDELIMLIGTIKDLQTFGAKETYSFFINDNGVSIKAILFKNIYDKYQDLVKEYNTLAFIGYAKKSNFGDQFQITDIQEL